MMKPEFDDLIEYVRSGENDPEMRELLDNNPDGQELLKQARFICNVLRQRYGENGDSRNVADADMASGGLDQVAAMKDEFIVSEEPAIRRFYQSAPLSEYRKPRKPRKKRPPSVDSLLASIESANQDLGVLKFATLGGRVWASYEASPVVTQYSEKRLKKVPTSQLGLLGLQIQSLRLNISLKESVAVDDPIVLRLSNSIRQTPSRYTELVFMPETGPFVRFGTDDQGDAELPSPIQSGILRIETSEPHFLQIKVEES
jgi:hypothetical protein